MWYLIVLIPDLCTITYFYPTTNYQRTSVYLNEVLPIRMIREKLKNDIFSMDIVLSVLEMSIKRLFLIGQVLIKKYGLKTQFLL